MELEHERRKERDRLQKDEALRSRELDEQVRRVEEVKREKVRSRSPYTSASRACAHVCRFASGALSSPFTLFVVFSSLCLSPRGCHVVPLLPLAHRVVSPGLTQRMHTLPVAGARRCTAPRADGAAGARNEAGKRAGKPRCGAEARGACVTTLCTRARARARARTRTRTHAHMHTHARTRTHARAHTHTNAHTHTTHARTQRTHARTRTRTRTRTHACTDENIVRALHACVEKCMRVCKRAPEHGRRTPVPHEPHAKC